MALTKLVLFDLLSRLEDLDDYRFCEDLAEKKTLWRLNAELEKTLVAPFRADYKKLVTAARRAITAGDEGYFDP